MVPQGRRTDDPDGQYCLGSMYENGWGVTRDLSEAAAWYSKAAKQGHELAQSKLGPRREL